MPGAGEAAPAAAQADECILPDDDDVRCVTEPPPPPTKPVSYKVRLPPLRKDRAKPQPTLEKPKEPVRVTSGGNPAPAPSSKVFATICLDSDDDEPVAATPAPAPAPRRTTRALPAQYSAAGGPVPVALTGPDSQPLPLPVPTAAPAAAPPPPQTAPASRTIIYPYPSAGSYQSEPVPVSLTGPDSRPVPISLTGPDNRPVPISLSGPGFQAIPISMGAPGPQAAPASYPGAPPPVSFVGSDNIPMSLAGMTQAVSSSTAGGGARATPAPGPAAGARTLRLSLAQGQASAALHHMANNIYLVPKAAAGDRLLTRVPASQVPPHMQPPPLVSTSLPASVPSIGKTYCKPGDILRLTPSGKLELVKMSPSATENVIHTIEDDENIVPAPKASTPRMMATKTPAPKVPTLASKPSPSAPKPQPSDPTAPAPTPRMREQTASTPQSDGTERRKRKVSSSSSSSDSSRCATPDPLSIFRDVVHIQAPSKTKTKAPTFSKTDSSKRPSTNQTKPTPSQTKSTSKSSSTQQIVKVDPMPKKLTDILSIAKTKKADMGGGGKTINTKGVVAKIKDSIDLTEISCTPAKAGESKKNMIKGGKPMSTTKKDIPSTVVGTSKSIVLDGKSKSLTKKDTGNLTYVYIISF